MHIANFQFTFRDHGEFEIRNLANFLDRIFKVRAYKSFYGISYGQTEGLDATLR